MAPSVLPEHRSRIDSRTSRTLAGPQHVGHPSTRSRHAPEGEATPVLTQPRPLTMARRPHPSRMEGAGLRMEGVRDTSPHDTPPKAADSLTKPKLNCVSRKPAPALRGRGGVHRFGRPRVSLQR